MNKKMPYIQQLNQFEQLKNFMIGGLYIPIIGLRTHITAISNYIYVNI